MAKSDLLQAYRTRRNFSVTPEPEQNGMAGAVAFSFVVQKHWATRLHYDFRLELDGTMKSWAIPKGPSFDPSEKRMAVHVEDHPISYSRFEGQIPAKQYGAGRVIIWDKGTWAPIGNARQGYRAGKLEFELHGHKLRGKWVLVRMTNKTEKRDAWLLIKGKDEFAQSAAQYSVVDEMPDSVAKLKEPVVRKAALTAHSGKNDLMLPARLKPELATLLDAAPNESDEWLYEIKFDGYRLLSRIDGANIRLYTRNGHDWTDKLAALAKALAHLHLPNGWYDGEIVMPNDRGVPDFQALQNAFDSAKTADIVYYLFDVPFCEGKDLTSLPLVDRRKKLQSLLSKSDAKTVRFSEAFEVGGRDIVASACKLGFEGIIGKRKTSPYVSRRSSDWIKLKCHLRQEFVVVGYTDPQGSRAALGALLLGVYDQLGRLRYAGRVGTGFNRHTLADMGQKLKTLHTVKSPFSVPPISDRKVHWVIPELVAEVSFAQWTQTGLIRHSVFQGLRTDKRPKAIFRESNMSAKKFENEDALLGTLKVSHPERVVDSSTKATKIDIVRYYALVAPLMLEHLKGRPVSLVRAPDGVKGELFFQKHLETTKMAGVRALSPSLDPGHAALMEVISAQGLLSTAQMNVIEFHTWNATKTTINKPDRMIFDLDPGKGAQWAAMQEAALVLHDFLSDLGLASFIKTSGGKGLHVVVPLKRRHSWDTVKDFSHAVALHMARILPQRYAAKSGPRNRVGKIFIDYLRNGFGATTVSPWSARARPGLGVSVPLAWDEIPTLTGASQWRISNIHERLELGNEPWKDYENSAKTLTAAMKTLSGPH